MMQALRVVQWSQVHETSESRKIKSLPWYAKPNKHHGLGYGRLRKQKDAAALYGAWTAILDVACRAPREWRGWLVRAGHDGVQVLGAAELSDMTGFGEGLFRRALEFFTDAPIGWLAWGEFPPGKPGPSAGASGESPSLPGLVASIPGESSGHSTVQDSTGQDLGKNKGGRGGAARASALQFAALNSLVEDLEKCSSDLTLEERVDLRKKRAELKALKVRQAKGEF